MNPFDDIENQQITTLADEVCIQIWVETFGRKKNTYVSGWTIDKDIMKKHLSTIKHKISCGGSIKDIPDETGDGTIQVLQLQGNHIDYILAYIQEHGKIDPKYISIKG
jgi:translation initiation factor 1 (eIF-1/SUI1)